ncbi:MAG: helix-turn-helix domain-containing protein [Pseudomonadota bacterium]
MKPAPVGRPKLLTRGAILDAAVEIGLEELTMKQLATHLNVGTATLYQYFDNRDALMRAAAVRSLSEVDLPTDEGQHWSAYARDYAVALMEILAENATYIKNYQRNDYGFEVLFRLAEAFLSVMQSRGFPPDMGMRIYHHVGLAAVAGAVEKAREDMFRTTTSNVGSAAKGVLDQLPADDLPLLREAFDTYIDAPIQKVDTLLFAAFSDIARGRGEDGDVVTNAFQDKRILKREDTNGQF